jgi:hypothetical protein
MPTRVASHLVYFAVVWYIFEVFRYILLSFVIFLLSFFQSAPTRSWAGRSRRLSGGCGCRIKNGSLRWKLNETWPPPIGPAGDQRYWLIKMVKKFSAAHFFRLFSTFFKLFTNFWLFSNFSKLFRPFATFFDLFRPLRTIFDLFRTIFDLFRPFSNYFRPFSNFFRPFLSVGDSR